MAARAPIIAGKTVIVVQVQDAIDTGLTKIASKLNKFANTTSKFGLELFSGGLLGSLGVGTITKQFQEFEDKLLFLSTKLLTTDQEFAEVEKTIRQLGRTTSFTSSEVADGATVLAQAGFKAKEVIGLLLPTLDLARGGQISLDQSGAILTNTMRSFGIETGKAGEVASQFIAASRLGTLEVLDLKESIKEVLGTVRNLNIDLPTTLGLLTQLAERSLKGTKAGTSLNTALLQLASKGKELAKLGIQLPTNLNGDSFINFLDQLYSKINKLGNLERTALLQRIFNIRGGRAITGLDEIKRIVELTKEIRNAGDEARKASILMDSKFGGAVRKATNSVGALTLRLGELVGNAITPLLRAIPQLSAAIEKLVLLNPELTLALLAVPPAALVAGAGLLTLSYGLGKLSGLVGLTAVGIKGLGNLFNKVLTKGLIASYGASRLLGRGLSKIDTTASALFLSPQRVKKGAKAGQIKPSSFAKRVGTAQIPLVAAAASLGNAVGKKLTSSGTSLANFGGTYFNVGAFRYAAKQNMPKFIAIVNKTGTALARAGDRFEAFGNRKAAFTGFDFQKIFQSPKGSFQSGQKLIAVTSASLRTAFGAKNVPLKALTLLAAKFEQLLVVIKKMSGPALKSGLAVIGNIFKGAGRGLFLAFSTLVKIDLVKTLFNISKAGLSIVKVFGAIGMITFRTLTTLSGWGNILTFLLIFGPKIEFIRKAFERLANGIKNAFSDIVAIATKVVPSLSLIGSGIRSIIGGEGDLGFVQIGQGLSSIVDIVGTQMTQAWGALTNAIQPAYDFMSKMIKSVITLGTLVGELLGFSLGTAFNGINGALGGGGGLVQKIVDSINLEGIFRELTVWFSAVASVINSTLKGLYNVVAQTMLALQEAIVAILDGLNERFGFKTGDLANRLMGGSQLSIENGKPKLLATGVIGLGIAIKDTNKMFDEFPDKMQSAMEKAFASFAEIFKKPVRDVVKEQNDAIDKLQVVIDKRNAIADANAAAAKREQQRLIKPLGQFGGSVPLLPGSLAAPVDPNAAPNPLADINKEIDAAKKRRAQLIVDNFIDPTDPFGGLGRQNRLNGIAAASKDLRSLVQQRKDLLRQQGSGFRLQQIQLADVVASTTGSFQATRNNLGKFSGKSIDQQQLDTLQSIQDNTGGAATSLNDILQKSGGLLFK